MATEQQKNLQLLVGATIFPPILIRLSAFLLNLFTTAPFLIVDGLHYILAQLLVLGWIAPAFGVSLPALVGLVPTPAETGSRAVAAVPSASSSSTAAAGADDAEEDGEEESEDEQRKKEILAKLPQLKAQLLRDLAAASSLTEDETYQSLLVVDKSPETQLLRVFRKRGTDWHFKLAADLPAPINAQFDIMADIRRRPDWDEVVAETKVVEELDATTRIEYFRSKPQFPSAARDAILLAHICALPSTAGPDAPERYLQLAVSVPYPAIPETPGVVRMNMALGGAIFEVLGDGQGARKTRVIGLLDMNPSGWVPSSIAKFLATVALPASYNKLSKMAVAGSPAYVNGDPAPIDSSVKLTPSTPAGSNLFAGGYTSVKASAGDLDSAATKPKTRSTASKGKKKVAASTTAPVAPVAVPVATKTGDLRASFEYAGPFLVAAGVVGIWVGVLSGLRRRR